MKKRKADAANMWHRLFLCQKRLEIMMSFNYRPDRLDAPAYREPQFCL